MTAASEMTLSPPSGSRLEVKNDNGRVLIIVPHRQCGTLRALLKALSIGSMFTVPCIWVVTSIGEVLAGWSIDAIAEVAYAGLACSISMNIMYRNFVSPLPAELRLGESGLEMFTGTPALKLLLGEVSQVALRQLLSVILIAPRRYEFTRNQIDTLRLREDGRRLTIEQSGRQVEIARSATDSDRKWLFALLQSTYG